MKIKPNSLVKDADLLQFASFFAKKKKKIKCELIFSLIFFKNHIIINLLQKTEYRLETLLISYIIA